MNHILKCRTSFAAVGVKHNRLTIAGAPFRIPCGKFKIIYVVCQCDCGEYSTVNLYNLRAGYVKSCGCLLREAIVAPRRHGLAGRYFEHPLYAIWCGIKSRCLNPNSRGYQKWYGSKGITVCDEWRDDPAEFISWAVSHGWEPGLHIDRVDGKKGYSPDNCRCVTPAVNHANQDRYQRGHAVLVEVRK